MKKMLAMILSLLLAFAAVPALAQSVSFSLVTDTAAQGALLMDENGNSLSTVVGSQSANGQTVWMLQVTDNGAQTAYLYTRDAQNNWLNTGISYPMSWIISGGAAQTAPTEQPAAEETPQTAWPVENYTLWPLSVYPLGESERIQSRCGPAKTYHGAGSYKTYKITSSNALFREGSFLLVDLDYTTVGLRRVYMPTNAFKDGDKVPEVTLTSTPAYTLNALTPTFGPGTAYDTFDEAAINAGTSITVFFEENGWVFAEFDSALGSVRAWIPADQVAAR